MAVKMINENGGKNRTYRPQSAEIHHGSTHCNDSLGNFLCNGICN